VQKIIVVTATDKSGRFTENGSIINLASGTLPIAEK
jgi:hypothetical protein